jgi:hypothetical protein
MGTRHLICVVEDQQYRLAQYGQWDGYPDGQGKAVLAFLHAHPDLSAFRARLKACRFAETDELKRYWTEAGADPDSDFVNMEVAEKHKAAHPQLCRDTGAQILELILNSTGDLPLMDDHEFAGSSLFCEWAYVIDFDTGTFEVFEGFNQTPLAEGARFASLVADDKYQPVQLKASWPLSELPSLDVFLATCVERDAEDAE